MAVCSALCFHLAVNMNAVSRFCSFEIKEKPLSCFPKIVHDRSENKSLIESNHEPAYSNV